jgi:hypothetical protein
LAWHNMDSHFLRNVILKGLAIFVVLNLALAVVDPAGLGRISIYNHLVPGRKRFPFGEDSSQSYNLSLFNLDAMFSSQVIAGRPKPIDEYRVIVVGDSSTWGILLHPEETLAGLLDTAHLTLCGRTVHAYNLGYPSISLTKDLMLLDYAMRYKPDLVIWPVTLEAFPADKQLSSPLVANNAGRMDELIARYHLQLDPNDPALVQETFWDKTILGQRRSLADLFRLQMYGVMWAATGIDQTYPVDYQPTQADFTTDVTFHAMHPPQNTGSQLAFDVLEAGFQAAGKIPVMLVNEPMLIGTGQNSQLRYNFLYPRWAYDQYRQLLSAKAQANGWDYLDLWDLVPADQFTNSAIHMTPAGEAMLAGQVTQSILQQSCP